MTFLHTIPSISTFISESLITDDDYDEDNDDYIIIIFYLSVCLCPRCDYNKMRQAILLFHLDGLLCVCQKTFYTGRLNDFCKLLKWYFIYTPIMEKYYFCVLTIT